LSEINSTLSQRFQKGWTGREDAMITYNDCLGLSGLTQDEVSALARIKHLPEVVALEMGWSLCRTPEGKHVVKRMILDDIEAACGRADSRTAAKLALVLHRFLKDHEVRDPPGELQGECDSLARVLRTGPKAARQVRESVDTCMAVVLPRFGLDRASVRERFPTDTAGPMK
jgi:hypothetical protein